MINLRKNLRMYTKLQSNIKDKLAAKNISVSELERRAGLKQSAIHNILHGRSKNPSIDTIRGIAQELNCSIEELIGEESISNLQQISKSHDLDLLGSDPVEVQEDTHWNAELFISAIQVINSIIERNNLKLPRKQILASVDEVYKYSIGISEDIDKRFAEWIIQKLVFEKRQ